MFWKVLLPASLPTVFTGIRMGAGFAFFMLIGSEMIGGAHSGLGFMIIKAQAHSRSQRCMPALSRSLCLVSL